LQHLFCGALYNQSKCKNTLFPWHSPPAWFWLNSPIASHHLSVAPQSGVKDQFCCTVYYLTLSSNCEAQGEPKNDKK